jgi:hypothetical protein
MCSMDQVVNSFLDQKYDSLVKSPPMGQML